MDGSFLLSSSGDSGQKRKLPPPGPSERTPSPLLEPSGEVCHLVLEDGTRIAGTSFGSRRSVSGEAVFNTGMVGYPGACLLTAAAAFFSAPPRGLTRVG
jgi:hypothetical protein